MWGIQHSALWWSRWGCNFFSATSNNISFPVCYFKLSVLVYSFIFCTGKWFIFFLQIKLKNLQFTICMYQYSWWLYMYRLKDWSYALIIGVLSWLKKYIKDLKIYVYRWCIELIRKMCRYEQEAHGPHRSPEKTVQINKHTIVYHNID